MINKKLAITTLALMATAVFSPANADSSCSVQVAVSSPPLSFEDSVAFNVTNDYGTNKSVTVKAGSAPQTISGLTCSDSFYNISATAYSISKIMSSQWIGQCILKAGPVMLNDSDNSVSVVFPNDFICN